MDLADLLENFIYRHIAVEHTDGSPLTEEEMDSLEEDIRTDLFFDYLDEELSLEFDRDSTGLVLNAIVSLG